MPMPPEDRAALLTRLQRDYNSASCLQPWTVVPVKREALMDIITLLLEHEQERRT